MTRIGVERFHRDPEAQASLELQLSGTDMCGASPLLSRIKKSLELR